MASEKEIVLGYMQAHNAGDVEKALTFFNPDVRFIMTGIWTRHGLEELQPMESWDAALNSRLDFTNLKSRSGQVDCQGSESSDWTRAMGIEQVNYDSIRFEIQGGKISAIRAKMASKSERAVDQAVNMVIRWALGVDPDEVDALVPRGLFHYGKDEALRWMEMIEQWKNNRPEPE